MLLKKDILKEVGGGAVALNLEEARNKGIVPPAQAGGESKVQRIRAKNKAKREAEVASRRQTRREARALRRQQKPKG